MVRSEMDSEGGVRLEGDGREVVVEERAVVRVERSPARVASISSYAACPL